MSERERAVAAFLIVAILGAVGFIIAYATAGGRLYEGLSLFASCAGLAAAAAGWALWLLPHERVVDDREEPQSPLSERSAQREEIRADLEVVTRRGLLSSLLYAAIGLFGLALVVPLRSLGPNPDRTLFATRWRKGSRIVRADGSLVRVDDMNVNSVETVFPQGAVGDAMSQSALIRVAPGTDGVDGYLAYSRVCTHAGCPVALYRAQQQQLMCPCHQSVFDVTNNGAVVSGPADAPLPRLPIAIDADGVLVALGDFPRPVGPGFWERP